MAMPVTEAEIIQRYLATRGCECPICHRKQCLVGHEADRDVDYFTSEVACTKCGAEFVETYTLTHIEFADGRPITLADVKG